MKKLLSALLFLVCAYGYATHNRAGEIVYTRVAPFTEVVGGVIVPVYTYSITLIKYTADGNNIADRCTDTLYFGDGERGVIERVNGPLGSGSCCPNTQIRCGEIIISDADYKVKKNIYRIRGTGVHRYSSTGSYLIRNYDPNRNAGVANIPNSVDQLFYVESYLEINAFTGANTSPLFHFDPIDRACIQKCFTHNPGAYDPDGDSLSYELTMCRGIGGNVIAGYTYPYAGNPGTFEIHPTKGLLTWCSPQNIAEYNIAFIVKEWRKNTGGVFQMIGYVIRDMQVVVGSCADNQPPQIITPADTCVEAGTLINRKIQVKDPNNGDFVTLEGEAGAFSGQAPLATLVNTSGTVLSSNGNSFFADFSWQTTCNHIRQQPYEMVFKAKDHRTPTSAALATFNSYNVQVIPPSVKNVTAEPIGSTIKVSWSLSSCSPVTNPLIGYKVYRKNDCTPFIATPCQTGVSPASGFVFLTQTGASTSFYIDNNNGNGLVVGQNYSYLVVATYSDGTQTYASSQVCMKLKRDIPLLLNVDVRTTSATNGQIYVRWTKPLISAGNFDTLALPGPYMFTVKYRVAGAVNDPYTSVFSTPPQPLFLKQDTEYVHTNINTIDNAYEYLVEFTANTVTVGTSQLASSVFLNALPGDRKINLQWTSKTPWNNKKYTVWRKDPGAAAYVQLNTTTNTQYTDSSDATNQVVNRSTYCYYVESEGEYSDPTIYKPLLNKSQEVCTTAKDLTPPCTPTLTVEADCPTGFIHVTWNNIRTLSCGDDAIKYFLYYKPTINDEYAIILRDTITSTHPFQLNYTYDGLTLISGCYAIQAMDSSNNISPMSPDFCIDNCPIFELPNVFSPNNDATNDFFQAITDRVRQIKEIDMSVFDRWGNLVYKTKDPYFKWDGINNFTKQPVSDGTLFYICDVYEPRLKGIVKRTLKGYVELVR